jgi:hypothetical protein
VVIRLQPNNGNTFLIALELITAPSPAPTPGVRGPNRY